MLARTALALVFLASASAAGGKVWVVDDDGGAGVDFIDIQPAIDAARGGDLVLVRTGTYALFDVTYESLTITADLGADVRLRCPAPCDDVFGKLDGDIASGSIVLRGLHAAADLDAHQLTWLARSTAPIFVEDCSLHRAVAQPNSRLVLVRSRLAPPLVAPPDLDALGVITATDSRLQLYECDIDGSPSKGSVFSYGGAAPAGVHFFSSGHVQAVRTHARGCDALGCSPLPSGPFGTDCLGAPGGAGLSLPATATARVAASAFSGGTGSLGGAACAWSASPCGAGAAGAAFAGGTTQLGPANSGALHIDSPIRVGQTAALVAHGDPGDFAVAVYAFTLLPSTVPGVGDLFVSSVVGVLSFVLPLGVIGPSGVLQAAIGAPSVPHGSDFLQLFAQGVFVSPSGVIAIGSGSVLDVLRASF